MIEQRGLPDFGGPVAGGLAYLPHQMGLPPFLLGPCVLMPHALDVAERPDKTPDFSLDLFRGPDPTRPPQPYARLDLRLKTRHDFDAALAALRQDEATQRATLVPARPARGFMRVSPIAGSGELPRELAEPSSLAWDGLDTARAWWRLSADTGLLLRDALSSGALLVRADVQLEIEGIAPRLAAKVAFDPRALLEALRARADRRGIIEREQVIAHFLATGPDLLTAPLPNRQSPSLLAEILTDRVRARFGAFAMGEAGRAVIALAPADSVGSGRFEWDLSDPTVVPRTVILGLDPFEAARRIVAARGIAAVVRNTTVPALETGALEVTVDVNLPPRPEGLLALGVNLEAPPAPPRRTQAAVATVELSPEQQTASAALKLAPGEPPEYFYTVFAVVRGRGVIDRPVGARTAHRGSSLYLSPGDLPLRFLPISAEAGVLDFGDVEVTLRWTVATELFEHRARLTRAAPELSLVLARDAENAALDFTLIERTGDGRRSVGPIPPAGFRLGLHTFPEYGPHAVQILSAATVPILLELKSETAGPDAPAQSVLLTPEGPKRAVPYFAESIFRPGYAWRSRPVSPDSEFSSWSIVPSPFSTLAISGAEVPMISIDDVTLLAGSERGSLLLGSSRGGAENSAPASHAGAALVLRDEAGAEIELVKSTTSAVPPYNAIFRATVDRDQLARVRRALRGEHGILFVRYHIVALRRVLAISRISGDASEDLAALMQAPTPEAAAARLEDALTAGRLHLSSPDESLPEDLRRRSIDTAKEMCSKMILNMATGTDLATNTADLRVEISLAENIEEASEDGADVGEWFATSGATASVIELPPGMNP